MVLSSKNIQRLPHQASMISKAPLKSNLPIQKFDFKGALDKMEVIVEHYSS